MEIITKYKANDGEEFLCEARCARHENQCRTAQYIIDKLPPVPDTCDFQNGSGYVQHIEGDLLKVRNEFLELCKSYTDHKFVQETIDGGFGTHISWADRVVSESAPRSITKHFHRFSCIDDKFREWGQPYYASNPEKAKQIRLN